MEIKNILGWCVQRHVEKELSQSESIRLYLQKTELIPCPIEYLSHLVWFRNIWK